MKCVGDPYGGGDCLCPSTSFAYGAVEHPEDGRPIVLIMPTCDLHQHLASDWIRQHNPTGESWDYPWDVFDQVRDRTIELMGDVFVYSQVA